MTKTKLQERAIARVLALVGGELDTERGEVMTHEITEVDYSKGFWLTVEKEMEGLSENNLLRYLSREHWHVWVGTRGGIRVTMAPKSYGQFAGQRAFSMNFAKNGSYF